MNWSVVTVHPELGEHPHQRPTDEATARQVFERVQHIHDAAVHDGPPPAVLRLELREGRELRAWFQLSG